MGMCTTPFSLGAVPTVAQVRPHTGARSSSHSVVRDGSASNGAAPSGMSQFRPRCVSVSFSCRALVLHRGMVGSEWIVVRVGGPREGHRVEAFCGLLVGWITRTDAP